MSKPEPTKHHIGIDRIMTPSGMMVKTAQGWYYWTHTYSEYGHRFEPFEPVATLSLRLRA